MERKLFRKFEDQRGHLECGDLTPEEKKRLYALLGSYGMSQSTAYVRFFSKGFDKWEMTGIDNICHDFITENDLRDMEHIRERFYSSLPKINGLRVKLVRKLSSLGMSHRNTIEKRFDSDDWKPWERMGITRVINEFCPPD